MTISIQNFYKGLSMIRSRKLLQRTVDDKKKFILYLILYPIICRENWPAACDIIYGLYVVFHLFMHICTSLLIVTVTFNGTIHSTVHDIVLLMALWHSTVLSTVHCTLSNINLYSVIATYVIDLTFHMYDRISYLGVSGETRQAALSTLQN